MKGHSGKALLINLSEKTASALCIEESVYAKFLGGRGLCGYFLDKYLEHDPIVFFNGIFTGTDITGSGLCSVMHKNPMTGGLFRSEFGGNFAVSLKKQGYDGIIIIGRAIKPLSVTIDGEITFKESFSDDFSVIRAGKSAEKGFLHCKIIADDIFTTHRGGTGYLMHDKNLLSVSVKKSSDEQLHPDREDIHRLINASPSLMGRLGISRFGTAALYDLAYARNMLPHNYFSSEPHESSNASAMINSCSAESFACEPCIVSCKKRRGKFPLPDFDDFALLLAVGIDIKDIPEIYFECFSQGYDIATVCHCINIIGANGYDAITGTDPRLANGAYALDKNVLCVKKLEIPAFDPRGAYGTALGYASSTNGADWTSTLAVTHEILRKPVATDRLSFDGKAWLNIASENAKAAADSLPVCGYTLFSVSLEEYAKILSQLTDTEFTAAALSESGGDIWMNEVKITRRLGFTIEDDTLPDVFFKHINKEDFDSEMKKYHRMRSVT